MIHSVDTAKGRQTLPARIAAAVSDARLRLALRLLPRSGAATPVSDAPNEPELLLQTQQQLSVALAGIDAGFIATDRAGRITMINEHAVQMLGWPTDEALDRSVGEVLGWPATDPDHDPETDGPWAQPVAQLLARGNIVDRSEDWVAVVRGSGQRVPLQAQSTLLFDGEGVACGAALVFRDITRLRRAEDQSGRLAAIVASSHDAIIGKDLDGTITSWNEAAHALFGYSADEAIGLSILIVIPPHLHADEARVLQRLARGERVPPFDAPRLTKDGRALTVSLSISPIRDAQGRIVGASKTARDVTAMRQAQAALRAADERQRFTLEAAQVGEWSLDVRTGAVEHSLQHDRCFGYEPFEGEWNLVTFQQHVHPEDRPAVARAFHDAVTGSRLWNFECRVIWPDSSVHWIRVHGSLQDDDGRFDRMLGIVVETTRERQAEEARSLSLHLENENRHIRETSRSKSLFLANMSHELRTPLNAIIGFSELLLSAQNARFDEAKRLGFLGHIRDGGRHLLRLINDVLDLSKVEAGKFEFEPRPFELSALIDGALLLLQEELERKQLQLTRDIDPTLPTLFLDPARMRQVLFNYLSNAIKFTPQGGTITLRVGTAGPLHFKVEVQDTGPGIAAADLPRLFTEFQQLPGQRAQAHGGTGLGLALTRRLVEAQGGSVGVRSELGQGTIFHLVLPLQAAPTEPIAQARPPGPDATAPVVAPAPTAQPTPTPPVARWPAPAIGTQPLVRALAEAGLPVDPGVARQMELLRALSDVYDAIVLDLLLPASRGPGMLSKVWREAPTSDDEVADLLDAAAAGDETPATAFAVDELLSKPIRMTEIEQVMRQLTRPPERRLKVMVVDDDRMALELMAATLERLNIDAHCVAGGRLALAELDDCRPDAMILDLMMPGFDGFAVLDVLNRSAQWRQLPVFVWTSMILTDGEYAELSRSARAVLSKGQGPLNELLDNLRRWRRPRAGSMSSPM